MRILLVKPKWFVAGGVYRYLEGIRFTPLHLGILAALSEGHDVRCVDGDWDAIPYREQYDVVGITVTTFTSEQVYRIAEGFRATGAKVVLGGVHASLLPDECLKHADAVVVGEAEGVWPRVLEDAARGALSGIYRAEGPTDMATVPFPRRDLLNETKWFACVQATRGCPNKCRYCYLPSVQWGDFRKRPLENVLQEIEGIPQKILFFVDDNLFADRAYALSLFRALKTMKKTWSVQMPTNVAKDNEVLDAMAESGCFNVQVGFQTVNPRSLDWADVRQNRIGKYAEAIERLHRRDFLVGGFFIFGFDHDDTRIFAETVNVVKEIDLDDAHLYILTPYPGTDLYETFKAEDRLLPGKARSAFGWSEATFQPALMSPETLERGVEWANRELFRHFRRQSVKSLINRVGLLMKRPTLARAMIAGSARAAHRK
jgi:radical SAM superfamily enzyme YgiQ (UPF0313 family)